MENPLFSSLNSLEAYKKYSRIYDINDIDRNGNTALFFVDELSYDKLSFFIGSGANINIRNNIGVTKFHLVCDILGNHPTKDKYKIVELFIDSGFDLNTKDNTGRTCLMALMNIHLGDSSVRKLLSKCSNLDLTTRDNNGYSAIDYARMNLMRETLSYLLLYNLQ